MSCLMLLPKCRCASEMFSRKAHNCSRCWSDSANTAFSKPASSKHSVNWSLSMVLSVLSVNSSNTCHGASIGFAVWMWAEDKSKAKALTNSKLLKRSAKCCCTHSNSFTAMPMLSVPTHAVTQVRTAGNSFKVAAVMMPKVPSEPMMACFTSKPVVFLCSGDKWLTNSPLGNTTSKPITKSRIGP